MDTCAKCKCGKKMKLADSDVKQYDKMLTCKCGRTVYDPEIAMDKGLAHNIKSESISGKVCECNKTFN